MTDNFFLVEFEAGYYADVQETPLTGQAYFQPVWAFTRGVTKARRFKDSISANQIGAIGVGSNKYGDKHRVVSVEAVLIVKDNDDWIFKGEVRV